MSDTFVAYGLWEGAAASLPDLKLTPDLEYLVGVERDSTALDAQATDFSFTDPKGLVLQAPVLKRSFSKKGALFYNFGMFFPATQADVVWDGIVRWVWSEGLRMCPLAGSDSVEFGSLAARSEPFVRPAVSPILRGSERQIQVVVEGHAATKVRKVFQLRGADLAKTQFGMRAATASPKLRSSESAGGIPDRGLPCG